MGEDMTEQYSIKALAQTKGTSEPVRIALLALEARVMDLEDALMRVAEETVHDHDTQRFAYIALSALGFRYGSRGE